MKRQNIILLLLFVMGLNACADFLEPKSQTEYVPRDINSLNELLIGEAYMDPRAQNYYVFCYNDLFSDDYACSRAPFNNAQNADKFIKYKALFAWHPDMFKLASQNATYFAVWTSTYQFILGCNAVLDYVDEVSGTEEAKAHVVAQALGLRAFYYFHLINLFGEPYYYNKTAPGVPLKLNSNMELELPKRATVEKVYEQIVADLEQAEKEFLKLPEDKWFIKNATIGLPMVQLMRARTALFMNDYATAVTYAKKVINDWGLSLYDLNAFSSTTAVPYFGFTTYDNPEVIWPFGCTIDMVRPYSLATANTVAAPTVRRIFNASDALLALYHEAGDDITDENVLYKDNVKDLRKKNYIVKEGTAAAVQSYYGALGKVPVNTSYAPVVTSFGRALRLSEAYLILAEAAYLNGDDDTAVRTLETLRKNRFSTSGGDIYKVPAGITLGETLFTFIKQERRREMCFEGLRWFDQRRWGMESFTRTWREDIGTEEIILTMEKNDPAYTLPIPYDAIEKNPNLTQNKLSTPKY